MAKRANVHPDKESSDPCKALENLENLIAKLLARYWMRFSREKQGKNAEGKKRR
jgi:hypothetical protein